MNQMIVMKFIEEKYDYLFPNDDYPEWEVEDALTNAPDAFEYQLQTLSFRNPSTMELIAFFPGSLGVDRFMLGDVAKGILKYFTFGGFGIWWIKDIFSAKKRCRTYNCKNLMNALATPSLVPHNEPKINIDLDTAIQIGKAVAPAVKSMAKGAKDIGSTFEVK